MRTFAVLCLAVCLALAVGCQVSVAPSVPGTVVSKMSQETPATVLRGRVITSVAMRAYWAAIAVGTPPGDDGETDGPDYRVLLCMCDKATWDGLVKGETYLFTIIEGRITAFDLVPDKR